MKAQVVYESMFGDTMLVAHAVAEGIARHGRVEVTWVGEAGVPSPDLDLLVVGGPTHAFGLSRPGTRHGSQAVVPERIGLRQWIATLAGLRIPAIAFDTRVATRAWLPGSAARDTARQLRRLRVPTLVPPESFYLKGALGPLLDGEVVRARHWGDWIGRLVTHGAAPQPVGALRH